MIPADYSGYPVCQTPEKGGKRGEKCSFQKDGGFRTLLHSPIVYDRAGNAIGGGSNKVTSLVRCHTCGKFFSSDRTELEIAQKKPAFWKIC